jgi:hypothetical protein
MYSRALLHGGLTADGIGGGEGRGEGERERRGRPLARELVRQLLTGLSHPAREKDHLARRVDISNDTPRELFGTLPTSLRSFAPFFFSFSTTFAVSPSDRPGSFPRAPVPIVPRSRSPATSGRSTRNALRLPPRGPGVSVIAHVSPLLIPLAVLFCRKGPPGKR